VVFTKKLKKKFTKMDSKNSKSTRRNTCKDIAWKKSNFCEKIIQTFFMLGDMEVIVCLYGQTTAKPN